MTDMVACFLGEYSNESYIEPKQNGKKTRDLKVNKKKNPEDDKVIIEGSKDTDQIWTEILAHRIQAEQDEAEKDKKSNTKNGLYNRSKVDAALVQRLLEDDADKEKIVLRRSRKEVNQKEKKFFDPEDEESVKEFYTLLLDQKIVKNGRNIDGALRKLILATRVYLKAPEILMLDEDFMTLDEFRGTTIYGKFWKMDVTIISILSDLKNVLLYDRVYVLDKGSVIESGRPQ
jgi:ABC-type lipopolysaccharide export system ATPase subunit